MPDTFLQCFSHLIFILEILAAPKRAIGLILIKYTKTSEYVMECSNCYNIL